MDRDYVVGLRFRVGQMGRRSTLPDAHGIKDGATRRLLAYVVGFGGVKKIERKILMRKRNQGQLVGFRRRNNEETKEKAKAKG